MTRLTRYAMTGLGLTVAALQCSPANAKVTDRDLLATICQKGKISAGQCASARNYPNGETCNVKLTGERAEGRFLGGDANYLLAVYSSDCEAHASSFGGSLLFEKNGDKITFKSYHPGLVMRDCLNIPTDSSGDQLICSVYWMGQGYQFQGVVEIAFTKDQAGNISTDLKNLLEANDSIGARGANIVECGKQQVYFGFDNLEAAPGPRTIALDITYADEAMIKEICASPTRNEEAGIAPLSEGEAYIAEGKAKTGRFVFKLENDALTPVK